MAYKMFESTNIKGKNISFVHTADLENGTLVAQGALVPGSKDIFNVVEAGADEAAKLYVVGNPAWSYDSSSLMNQNEDAYINAAGKVVRTYELAEGDKFAVTGVEPIDASTELEAGQFVVVTAGGGLKAAAAQGSGFGGEIVRVRKLGAGYHVGPADEISNRKLMVTILVRKNG